MERFGIIALNTKHKIVGVHIIGSGTIDRAYIEPRQVYMAALMNNAKAIIAFHNHPSGDATPSRDDLEIFIGNKRGCCKIIVLQQPFLIS